MYIYTYIMYIYTHIYIYIYYVHAYKIIHTYMFLRSCILTYSGLTCSAKSMSDNPLNIIANIAQNFPPYRNYCKIKIKLYIFISYIQMRSQFIQNV